MTDTTIRVTMENRKRLKAYAGLHDMNYNEALETLLNEVDAPEVENE